MDHDKDGKDPAIERMAGWMGGAMEAAAAGQALTLALLQAEMEAIAQLLRRIVFQVEQAGVERPTASVS